MADCKVKLSIRGGSGLSIQDYSYCPQLLKHKMDGVRFHLIPEYFVTGRIVHENIETIIAAHLEGKEAKVISDAELETIYTTGEYVRAGDAESALFEPDKKPITFIPKVLTAFKSMLESDVFGNIQASEAYYEGALVDPETFETNKQLEDEGVLFSGKVDLISDIDGHKVITDFKTCKSALKQNEADSSTQLTMYSYMYIIEHKEIANHVGLAYMTKHVRDDTQYDYLRSIRHFEHYVHLYRNLLSLGKDVSRSIDEDDYPKKGMLADCRDKFNKLCNYHPMCFQSQYTKDELKEFESHLKEKTDGEEL